MEWGTVVTAILGIFGTILTGFGTVLGVLWRDVKTSAAAHLACEVKHAKLQETVEGLKREIDALRFLTKDETSQAAWITCDISGKILDAGGRITLLFRYRPTELIGKNVKILIPPEYEEAHSKGLEKIAHGESIRQSAIIAEAIRSDSTRVNIVITLTVNRNQGECIIRAELFELKK